MIDTAESPASEIDTRHCNTETLTQPRPRLVTGTQVCVQWATRHHVVVFTVSLKEFYIQQKINIRIADKPDANGQVPVKSPSPKSLNFESKKKERGIWPLGCH